MPSIPPANNHYINLEQFLEMKAAYAANVITILAPDYQGKNILATSELFNADAVRAVVAVTGCAAIRVYYGMDDEQKVHAMMVAVDKDSQDILPAAGGVIFARNGDPVILEEGQRCPPFCP